MNNDERSKSAGEGGLSEDDEREDIGRREESDLTADFVLFETDAEDGFYSGLRKFVRRLQGCVTRRRRNCWGPEFRALTV